MKIVVVAALSAMVVTGCGDTGPAPAEKAVVEPSASSAPNTPASAPKQDGTASRPFDFGTLATSSPKSRWDVTVTEAVTAGGAELVLAENLYNEVQDGWDYVLGRMTSVVNENLPSADAGEPVSPTASVMPVFIGGDGRIYDIWNDDNSAVVMEEDWIGQPEIIAKTGIETTGRFAIQVPRAAIPGGQFATRNEVNGTILYFGAPIK
ncbi:hypothetical protein MUK71_01285 [Arthrobacter zhangbolii]|uniref:Lipoprotein n=1 Tax=Arthrobacter zhangbolii TaxID=2886936 RepID=A0ABY4DNT6_9MICC|nr:hypothetical protein [Arthrobacter zhangbolii]UON92320.1 hypothetical protein MUK71_01285 [Arthrobacter zhangbolii]